MFGGEVAQLVICAPAGFRVGELADTGSNFDTKLIFVYHELAENPYCVLLQRRNTGKRGSVSDERSARRDGRRMNVGR